MILAYEIVWDCHWPPGQSGFRVEGIAGCTPLGLPCVESGVVLGAYLRGEFLWPTVRLPQWQSVKDSISKR